MKKMLLIVPSLHQGGLEKVCAATARLLQPYFDVQIAIFDSRNIAYDIKGIPVMDLHLPSREGKVGKIINVLKRGIRLHRLKKEKKIDIAYSFGPTANLANIFSGKGGHRTAQNWLGIRSYMDMGNARQIRLFARFSDRLICCSETIYQEVTEKYGCRHACTLHNPFDIAEVSALAEQEKAEIPWDGERIITSMGREDVVKGFWHLLKIFKLVHEELRDTRLMIIGKGEFDEYRELAYRLGIGDEVYFAGLKKNPYPYLKQSTLYMLTSYYEGFPNALVEAMALGIPVVATDCMTGPKEILQDRYGILVPNMSAEQNLDPEDISEEEKQVAEQVIRLLQDEKQMEQYRRRSLERAAMYSKDDYIQKIREWAE